MKAQVNSEYSRNRDRQRAEQYERGEDAVQRFHRGRQLNQSNERITLRTLIYSMIYLVEGIGERARLLHAVYFAAGVMKLVLEIAPGASKVP